MDYLFFCTGECDDAMRDRDFYLVHHAKDEDMARAELARHLAEDVLDDPSTAVDEADTYSVFVKGENLSADYRTTELDCSK
jgi:hypothetical protein